MTKVYDTLILGGGPAGLSVALGLGRVHRTCAIFSNSKFRNDGIYHSHSVLSRDHVPPEDIRSIGRQQIERYGNTDFVETTITRLQKTYKDGSNAFTAEDEQGRVWRGRTIALAMGSEDIFPDIRGYAENWPLNIYQCLFCDGHERMNLPKGVLAYSLHPMYMAMASMAHYQSLAPGASYVPMAGNAGEGPVEKSKVTIFTNGEVLDREDEGVKKMFETSQALGIRIEQRRIERLTPAKDVGLEVVLGDGENLYMGFLVHKPPTMPKGAQLIQQLDVETTETPLGKDVKRIEPMGTTNVQGVYVAGDLGTPIKQVAAAMFHGVGAAAGISHELAAQDDQIALAQHRNVSLEDLELSKVAA